jgi:hypothetical protein
LSSSASALVRHVQCHGKHEPFAMQYQIEIKRTMDYQIDDTWRIRLVGGAITSVAIGSYKCQQR